MVHGLDRGCPAIPATPMRGTKSATENASRQRSAGISATKRRAEAERRHGPSLPGWPMSSWSRRPEPCSVSTSPGRTSTAPLTTAPARRSRSGSCPPSRASRSATSTQASRRAEPGRPCAPARAARAVHRTGEAPRTDDVGCPVRVASGLLDDREQAAHSGHRGHHGRGHDLLQDRSQSGQATLVDQHGQARGGHPQPRGRRRRAWPSRPGTT
jgi:hypothetical protein